METTNSDSKHTRREQAPDDAEGRAECRQWYKAYLARVAREHPHKLKEGGDE